MTRSVSPIYLAIQRLCDDLGLPPPRPYSQDWAYELPEAYRTRSYLEKYLGAYEDASYGDVEKGLLMQLMVDITNEFLDDDSDDFDAAWEPLRALLKRDHALHGELIEHWAHPGHPLEDAFALAPFMRDLRAELGG